MYPLWSPWKEPVAIGIYISESISTLRMKFTYGRINSDSYGIDYRITDILYGLFHAYEI